jgi:hypothetical protein
MTISRKTPRQLLKEIRKRPPFQRTLKPDSQNGVGYKGDDISTKESNGGGVGLPPIVLPPNTPQPLGSPNQPAGEPKKWWQDRKYVLELCGFVILCAYTWFACLQWLQIRYTNGLTARALDGNKQTLDLTLGKMQAQIDTANAQYGQQILQTGHTATMAASSETQATATTSAAQATKDAADTAKEALHTTERAYITTGAPTLNMDTHIVSIPVVNTGHIPSGAVKMVVHEATLDVNPTDDPRQIVPSEQHWQHYNQSSIPAIGGASYTINTPVPGLITDKMNDGHQQIIVAGSVSYNDGFPKPDQTWLFCVAGLYFQKMKRIDWMPCDAELYIKQLTSGDHYPLNEYSGRP